MCEKWEKGGVDILRQNVKWSLSKGFRAWNGTVIEKDAANGNDDASDDDARGEGGSHTDLLLIRR